MLSEKETTQLNKILEKRNKLFSKKHAELRLAVSKAEKKITDKYAPLIAKLREEEETFYLELNKCKRCLGRGYIFSRACAEDEGQDVSCPSCGGSGAYAK